MPNEFRYWRTDGRLHLRAPGIKVLDRADHHHLQPDPDDPMNVQQVAFPDEFSRAARDNLNYIYRTATGQTILNALSASPQAPTLAPAVGGNSIQIISRAHMRRAAVELHGGQAGPATRAAIGRMVNNQPVIRAAIMLANAVNNTPMWTLDARPGHANVAAMSYWNILRGGHSVTYMQSLRDRAYQYAFGWDSNEGYSEDRLYVGTQHGQQVSRVLNAGEMNTWLLGGALPDRVRNNQQHLHHVINVCIARLYRHDTSGGGAGCSIGWRHQPDFELNQRRPPAIGLAHELIHAYHALRGDNPGVHDQDPSVTMFEYRCVGLGPFERATVTENALRAEWGAIIQHIPAGDTQNRRVPGQRVSYF